MKFYLFDKKVYQKQHLVGDLEKFLLMNSPKGSEIKPKKNA